ncbi:transposase [Polaromonas sp. P1(28)-13]|nr:transposase [Polaromonas sp. P1(28)-13]
MLKDSETQRYSTRRTHRTYSPEFKAELLAACQTAGVSIAALAGQHGMNANVLHRWLKEHRTKTHSEVDSSGPSPANAAQIAAFIPLQLSAPTPTTTVQDSELKVELRKGALSMVITWPTTAVDRFVRWSAEILK